jgi:hypothetical protein
MLEGWQQVPLHEPGQQGGQILLDDVALVARAWSHSAAASHGVCVRRGSRRHGKLECLEEDLENLQRCLRVSECFQLVGSV